MNTITAPLKKWRRRGRAMMRQDMFAIQVIVALLLSVLCSDRLGLDYPGWAALSSFAVMNTAIKASALRACHRITGTLIGGGLGLLVAPYLSQNPAFLVVFCAVVGGIAVWRAGVSSWSYSWVLGGVTAMMVMAEAQKTSDIRPLFSFTFARIEEVALGCAICVLVTIMFYPLNRRSPHPHQPENQPKPTSRLLLPLQAAVALLLVTPILLMFQMTGFWQAMVSVLALFVLAPSAAPVQEQINQRMQQRFAGCLAATLLSLLLLPLLHHSAAFYIITLIAGVWLGCHLQQGKPSFSYFGRQFTVAWIIVFIQDTLWLTEPVQAVMRCASILMAIAVIGLVMLVFRSLNIPA